MDMYRAQGYREGCIVRVYGKRDCRDIGLRFRACASWDDTVPPTETKFNLGMSHVDNIRKAAELHLSNHFPGEKITNVVIPVGPVGLVTIYVVLVEATLSS